MTVIGNLPRREDGDFGEQNGDFQLLLALDQDDLTPSACCCRGNPSWNFPYSAATSKNCCNKAFS